MAGPEQIRRHTGSHVAKPNESDFHDPTSPVASAVGPFGRQTCGALAAMTEDFRNNAQRQLIA